MTKKRQGRNRYEKQIVSRLRTNSVEYATVIRGAVQSLNTGGVGGQAYAFYLNYPGEYFTPAAAIAQCPNVSGILAEEQKMFDEYRVLSLKVRYLTWVTQQSRVSTAVAFTAPTDPLLCLTLDYDDAGLFTTTNKALSAQNQPAWYNSYSDRVVPTITMKQEPGTPSTTWLNIQSIVPGGAAPADADVPTKRASVKVWKQAYLLANTVEATILAEWTVLLKSTYSLA